MTRPASALVPARRKLACAAALGLIAGFAFGPAQAQDANPVVAKVDGVEIRQSEITIAAELLGPAVAQMDEATKRESIITYVIDMKLAAKAADAKKIGDSEDFKRRLAFARDKLLMDRILDEAGKAALTEESMRKVYDDATKQIASEVEVRARHILVDSEADAKDVLAEIKKGKDFAELAKTKSKDPGAADGGDLGYFTKDQMVKEFSEVAFKTEPGKVSDPVKTQFGWHVIKVEDKRNRKAPEFAEVKSQIENYVTRKAQADAITKLRESAKIERMDKPADDKKAPEKK